MKAIEIDKLTKNYGSSRGITELCLSVDTGDFYGFIGPNGAGKSTTIRTILGYIRPTSGSARILGTDIVSGIDEIHKRTGYLPSEINFYKGMKVKEVLSYSAKLRGLNCDSEAAKLCERLDLDTSKRVEELSLGNRKKVGIICAVQHHPELLILDEPTSGLDPLMQREFFNILTEENKRGATIFFSSHVLSEVQEHCRMAAFIRDGRIIIADKVGNLKKTGAKKVVISGEISNSDIEQLKCKAEAIDNVERTASGKHTSFLYHGDIKELLRFLIDQDIRNVNITEPSLEEIFMNYYDTKQAEGQR
ncbi:ABC-2 type transport system ATP-binding protein [Eubacterium ruminantium]|nr:ABC-2 type transport system ATP-binding protein [Eubacterium ruminantium]